MSSSYAEGERASDVWTMERELLFQILVNTASFAGDEFFHALTRELATLCRVRIACISEVLLEANKARVIAGYQDGDRMEAFEYDLGGTPCGTMVAKGGASYELDVSRKYPADHWLEEVGAEAYLAVP